MDNGHEPATKADIAELRGEMKAMEMRLDERFAEVVRDSRTEILKAIYGYTHSTEVERRLNLPNSKH